MTLVSTPANPVPEDAVSGFIKTPDGEAGRDGERKRDAGGEEDRDDDPGEAEHGADGA